jgi:hypothetical protein
MIFLRQEEEKEMSLLEEVLIICKTKIDYQTSHVICRHFLPGGYNGNRRLGKEDHAHCKILYREVMIVVNQLATYTDLVPTEEKADPQILSNHHNLPHLSWPPSPHLVQQILEEDLEKMLDLLLFLPVCLARCRLGWLI